MATQSSRRRCKRVRARIERPKANAPNMRSNRIDDSAPELNDEQTAAPTKRNCAAHCGAAQDREAPSSNANATRDETTDCQDSMMARLLETVEASSAG